MTERHLLAQRTTDPIAKRVAASLYLKELAIISLITEGYRNKQIGARLNVGEGTVKNYCRNIYNATGMGSRVELAVFALQHPELIAASHEAISAVDRKSSTQSEQQADAGAATVTVGMMPFLYVAQWRVRPSSVATVKFITNAEWKFECGTIAAATNFPCLVHLKIGKRSLRPFNSAVDLFARVTLHIPIVVEPSTVVSVTFQNKSSKTRKWNAVQLVLEGSHMLPEARA